MSPWQRQCGPALGRQSSKQAGAQAPQSRQSGATLAAGGDGVVPVGRSRRRAVGPLNWIGFWASRVTRQRSPRRLSCPGAVPSAGGRAVGLPTGTASMDWMEPGKTGSPQVTTWKSTKPLTGRRRRRSARIAAVDRGSQPGTSAGRAEHSGAELRGGSACASIPRRAPSTTATEKTHGAPPASQVKGSS